MVVMTEDANLNATLDTYLAKLGENQSMQIGISSNGDLMSRGTRLFGTLTKVYNTYATFLVVGYMHQGTIVLKTKYNGVWSEWEYINPPMLPGIEYRTTERQNGKPVYTTLLNVGSTVNGVLSVDTGKSGTLIRDASLSGGRTLPLHASDGELICWALNDVNKVQIYATNYWAGNNVSVQLWYTKD